MHILLITTPLFASLASAGIFDSIQSVVKTDDPAKALASWSYTECGHANDPITLHSVSVSPDPPVPGSPLSVNISFTANEPILTGAYIDVVVKVGYIKILQKEVDLCEEGGVLKDTGISCPVEKGDHVLRKEVDLPKEIPPAKFTVNAKGYTVLDEDMFCVDVFADFLTNVGRVGL
ncbi:related to Phosphatidylglycerol/phosphatidylinositol transfer protein [Phialocephala subalpina]|uniref:Phosphatidylglycerol/phosphatidylinositol transfer protein n=1 Tax=Phialocephala subalpina TaxID=576137 RepID=A0A1L7X535_9HELO|nr:related to Phosphatidylglycerol/phosphatidylinositol transfer protein [Phialocephala subalpina]